MRKFIVIALIVLNASTALAAEETAPASQPLQLSDAQWDARSYPAQQAVSLPLFHPRPEAPMVASATPAPTTPDITNSWDVMQFNFGM